MVPPARGNRSIQLKINLGAGGLLLDGFTNVDIEPLPGIDVVHDLDAGPWPWDDASASEIVASDIFEHVDDPLLFMGECGRVLEDQGILRIRTSYWRSENAFTDPTHRRACTEKTFDYWCPSTVIGQRYGPAYARGTAFAKLRCAMEGQELVVVLRRLR